MTKEKKFVNKFEDKNHDHDVAPSIGDVRLWLAGVTSIVVISLCGIFGVLVVPIMQKVFYQHLIQVSML